MNYGVYNSTTGEISKVVSGSPAMAQLQCGAGESLFPDCPIDATHIVNGQAVKNTPLGQLMADIRAERNRRISGTDWTQLTDIPLTPNQKTSWAAYRQQLRDFPETCDPYNPVWPASP